MDTGREQHYDGLVMLAARVCDAPMAVLSFADATREWPKAHTGGALEEVELEASFARHLLNGGGGRLIVPDAAADERFASHPWVAGGARARFYAGLAITVPDGPALGGLAVLDRRPRDDGEHLLEELAAAAHVVQAQLETRREVAHGEVGRLLWESEERFRSAFDDAPIGMAIIGFDGELRRVNAALALMLGYTEAELLSLSHPDVVHPGDRGRARDLPREMLSGGERSITLEERLLHRDGHPVWASVRALVTHDAAGEPVAVLAQIEDVTVRREAERVLAESRAAAERANRAKSEFLARMSHELRTPLNAILGFAQLLELDDLTAEQRDGLERILRGGRHLVEVVDDVLDISRIEAGEFQITPEPVPAAAIAEEVVALLRPLANERGMVVRTDFDDAESLVRADPRRLKQVLLNLVSNAIKYGPEESQVMVRARSSGDRVTISVLDQGPGIPPDEVESAFAPFVRLRAHARLEGTGLGLALSRNLVHAMGGEIGVRSAEGSELWVALPTADPAAAGPEASDEPGPEARPAGTAGTAEQTLVYIEDDQSNVELVRRVVELRPNVRLETAADGAAGVELTRSTRPDAVLLDLDLPGVHGMEVLGALREDASTADIPVIVVTADASAGLEESLLAEGAAAFGVKPLDVHRLLATLADARGSPGNG